MMVESIVESIVRLDCILTWCGERNFCFYMSCLGTLFLVGLPY